MTTGRRIYLDHNATSPLVPEARAAVLQAIDGAWGNPSSVHTVGRHARDTIERARREVAALLGALTEEIVFTSGGTEGDNLAIRGLAIEARARRGLRAGRTAHVISSAVEHPAVHGALDELAREGFAITRLAVGPCGEIALEALRAALREETILVTLALANHELGNLYPIADLAALTQKHGALFHTDAVQAAGRVPIDVQALRVDAATISAHKLGGPKGVGAVYLRSGRALHPLVAGGHQERAWRAGTENLPGIAGFGEACRLARVELAQTAARISGLRDRLETRLLAIPGARRHGDPARRAPGTCNVGFDGAQGQMVLIGLDLEGICVSTGAACTSGTLAPSPVLLALGLTPTQAREAVRFSLGRETTLEDIQQAAEATANIVARVRAAAISDARSGDAAPLLFAAD